MPRWTRTLFALATTTLSLVAIDRSLTAEEKPAVASTVPSTQPAADMNTLTDAEKAAGWKLLFDGKTTTGWRGYKKEKVPDAWQVIDGALVRVKRGGDLITIEKYESFDLVLDWRISKAGNSGVIYHATEEDVSAAHTAPECQILDNVDGADPQRAGWCYALYQPPDDPKTGKPLDTTNPVGQWNTMRILVDGNHVEHWMNGVKYVEYELGSDDWNSRVAKSKFAAWPHWGKAKTGYIALQDHNGEVAFRNIKLRVIEPLGK